MVFSGHVFHSLTLPAALPESITTLVFDSVSARPAWPVDCSVDEVTPEEGACPGLTTLVFQSGRACDG